ncbi:M48 metallopeptidase family protein [Streptomyces hydrogenans]|uniref:M48 metallopeptidase family protein n=1 Tax=Streptomyces hydrogenans TaxID=1873719 RepID=UPI0035E3A618
MHPRPRPSRPSPRSTGTRLPTAADRRRKLSTGTPESHIGHTKGIPLRPPGTVEGVPVEIRRSARRTRSVSAYREGDRTIVLIPARMSEAEERRWVGVMLEKLDAKDRDKERRATRGDAELAERAARLSAQYLDGKARPDSVRWVTNQNSRWGSCTPAEGTIRLSHRLQGMPEYVVDYVLLHELAHLLVPGHGPAFWRLLEAYSRTERARGYLEGVVAADRLPHPPDGDPTA